MSIYHRPGDAESCGSDALRGNRVASGNGLRQECFDQLFEAGEILRCKSILEEYFESSTVFLERGEVAFRAADVSRQYQTSRLSRRCDPLASCDREFNGSISYRNLRIISVCLPER
jgi:hypothetical protein